MKIVVNEDIKKRLDKYLANVINKKSRSEIKRSIKKGLVTVNNEKITKPSYEVQVNDIINITFSSKKKIKFKPEKIPIDIVYEDEFLLILNKSSDMVVHPAKHHESGTLVNGLLYHFKKLSKMKSIRPGIVHRLDKNTTGLMVVAKNDNTHKTLSKMIEMKEVRRIYWAVLVREIKKKEGTVIAPIGRNKNNRTKMSVELDGKYAETEYRILKSKNGFSLVEFELKTGRTHQIRVHSDYIGHPIIGDTKYGDNQVNEKYKEIQRPLLHSKIIKFSHPNLDKYIEIEINLPEDFLKFSKKIRLL